MSRVCIGEVSVCRLARSERPKAYAIHCVPWLRFSHVRNKIQKAIKQHYFISESLSSFSLFVLAYTIYIYTTNRRHSHFHNEQSKKGLVRILFGIVCILRSLALCKYVLHVHLSLAVWTVFCKCVFFSRRDTWVCKCDRKKSK